MPQSNNTDLSKHYQVDRDKIDTRQAHGEASFERALGKKPVPVQPAPPKNVGSKPEFEDLKPPAGKGGLAK